MVSTNTNKSFKILSCLGGKVFFLFGGLLKFLKFGSGNFFNRNLIPAYEN